LRSTLWQSKVDCSRPTYAALSPSLELYYASSHLYLRHKHCVNLHVDKSQFYRLHRTADRTPNNDSKRKRLFKGYKDHDSEPHTRDDAHQYRLLTQMNDYASNNNLFHLVDAAAPSAPFQTNASMSNGYQNITSTPYGNEQLATSVPIPGYSRWIADGMRCCWTVPGFPLSYDRLMFSFYHIIDSSPPFLVDMTFHAAGLRTYSNSNSSVQSPEKLVWYGNCLGLIFDLEIPKSSYFNSILQRKLSSSTPIEVLCNDICLLWIAQLSLITW